MTCLARGELERAGEQEDYADGARNGARHRQLLHLECRQ
jgi:hypothetical protein